MKSEFKIRTGDIDEKLIKQTALVYIGIVFLALIAIGFVLPWYSEVGVIRNDFKKTEARTKEMSGGLLLLDGISKTVSEEDQEMLQDVMPVVFDPGLILLSLRRMSRAAGVSVVEYSLAGGSLDETEMKTTTKIKPTRLKVKVSGATSGVMSFMKMVEESVPLASVAEVSVGQVAKMIGDGDNDGVTSLSLTVDYYSLPVGKVDKLEMSKYIINEKDLATLALLKGYRQKEVVVETSTSGGNRNLFGE